MRSWVFRHRTRLEAIYRRSGGSPRFEPGQGLPADAGDLRVHELVPVPRRNLRPAGG